MKNTLFLFLLLFSAASSAQKTWFVNAASGAPAPDGLSWAGAFPDLHQALAAAQTGDEIWVAQGTYRPGADRFAVFQLPGGVSLYGGFQGAETQRGQRDPALYLTILSGDIGTPGDSTDNSFGILYAKYTGAASRIDGLIIEEANANNPDINIPFNSPTRSGGGIYLDGRGQGVVARLIVANCLFRRNAAFQQGGAVFADGRDGGEALLRLENSVFDRNAALGKGGAVAIESDAVQSEAFEARGCAFTGNRRGALWSNARQAVYFADCSFVANRMGQVIRLEAQGQLHPLTFLRCDFSENTPGTDGVLAFGLNNAADTVVVRLSQCRFYANLAPALRMGGSNSNGKFKLLSDNTVFHQNFSQTPLITLSPFAPDDVAQFVHCLFYGNNTSLINRTLPGTNPTYVVNSIILSPNTHNSLFNGNTQVEHCLLSRPDCSQLGPNTTCGPGILFDPDPLFVLPTPEADADFRLQPCSPAINAADSAVLKLTGIATDLDGAPRIRQGNADIGPYETDLLPGTQLIKEVSCHGASDGTVAFEPNLCAPYTIAWPGGQTGIPVIFGLPGGQYPFTFTDARGVEFVENLFIGEPLPLQLVYTVQNASGPDVPDGAILFSAVTGGAGAPVPADMTGLLPGMYSVTVTDANGCSLLEVITVGYTVSATEPEPAFSARIYPNPTVGGMPAIAEISAQEAGSIRIYDVLGRLLQETDHFPGSGPYRLPEALPAGLYRVEWNGRPGKRVSMAWIVH